MKQEETLDQTFGRLEELVGRMEAEDISLEESFALYHKGMDLLKSCNDKIDKIEKKMLILDEEGETHEFRTVILEGSKRRRCRRSRRSCRPFFLRKRDTRRGSWRP